MGCLCGKTGLLVVFAIAVLAWIVSSFLKSPPYVIENGWLDTYDYIIVGAGSAGCVLAHRLSSQSNASVLLVEAGPAVGGWLTDIPLAAIGFPGDPSLLWTDTTEPQTHASQGCIDNRCPHPHGKVLGGSSAVNMMVYSRGSRSVYDRWETEAGATGWSWKHVEPYFRKLEHLHGLPQEGAMGREGRMHIQQDEAHSLSDVIAAAAEELGVHRNDLYNSLSSSGTGIPQVTQLGGTRWNVARGYLRAARNLHVIVNAHVTKILIENREATGIEFYKEDKKYKVLARREVILSAGATNSPHLLMLSGIGPAEELKKHNIDLIADLPVGENLQNHPALSETIFHNSKEASISMGDFSIYNLFNYAIYGKGPLAGNPVKVMTFLHMDPQSGQWTSNESLHTPNVQIMFLGVVAGGFDPGNLKDVLTGLNQRPDYSAQYFDNKERPFGTTIAVALTQAKSKGKITLHNSDPFTRPNIQANLLIEKEDRDTLKGGRYIEALTETKTMKAIDSYILDKKLPNRSRACKEYLPYSEEYLNCYIKTSSSTVNHECGTCRMGPDTAQSVVDPRLRVHGITHLRVVDAAIIPIIPTANTNGPVIMIAEKASEMILEDARDGTFKT